MGVLSRQSSCGLKRQGKDNITRNIIFLHGLLSSSQAYKAGVLRKSFPGLIVPDFTGPLEDRMVALYPILGDKKNWTIVGSSLGGLMGAIFTCEHPDHVDKLVMLAPALILPQFAPFLDTSTSLSTGRGPVSVPTTIIHGTRDTGHHRPPGRSPRNCSEGFHQPNV